MEQFYDVYVNKPKLAPQVRVLAWTHNLMIMGQNKRHEDREFYLGLAVKAKWSSREFAHQIKTVASSELSCRTRKSQHCCDFCPGRERRLQRQA
jgi:hypothetical protein